MKFELTPEQVAKFEKWRKTLPPSSLKYTGGRYTISFNPTGIGTIVKVLDNKSKAELDLTEYENW